MWLLTILRILFLAYVGLGLFALLCANGLIFPVPAPTYRDTPGQTKLPSPDGNHITAVYLPNPSAPYTLLYSHGNAEDLGTIEQTLHELRARGWAVFAYDYPGYGTSTGKPSESGCYAAIAAAYSYLTTLKNVPPERIVLYGRSLGSGPSLELATHVPVGGIILDGAFTSTFRVFIPCKLLFWDKFDNLAKITHLHPPLPPILSIHGTVDKTVPFWHGVALDAAYPGPKEHLWIQGADHNNILEVAPAAYWDAIERFRLSLPASSPATTSPQTS
jgi:fermentation-respiration switch protein FrsA (DUF1100 family)